MLSITLLRIVCAVANFVLFLVPLVTMALQPVKELVRDLNESLSAFVRNAKAALRTSEEVSVPIATTESSVPAAEPIPDSSINASSSNTTNKVETVGSVKRCKDKITAILDMMDERNLQAKCEEIKTIIGETEDKCLPWLSRHIVTNRVSIELNHHKIYLSFLNVLNHEKLIEFITLYTEKNIKELISEDGVSPIPICRKTLNNLGSWYGLMTLARNQSISTTFGDLNMLLIKAYQDEEDKMSYILPLVVRMLEACSISTAFNTTSPWTLAVLQCLSELHSQPDFELKFRFEIELLMKKLKIELQDVKPTSYLTNTA